MSLPGRGGSWARSHNKQRELKWKVLFYSWIPYRDIVLNGTAPLDLPSSYIFRVITPITMFRIGYRGRCSVPQVLSVQMVIKVADTCRFTVQPLKQLTH